ncbi:MAG: response regulator transcription factor [Clostridiales bacterium]|nr:response regulator transcription factor [Clostridiales bacterium]
MHRIFIVEDDTVIAESIRRHISAWGCEVRCADNFENVLSEFVDFDPQLVLMDISLPFFNGYHWCAEIRRISKVPIIFISSASDNMNIVMAVNMGGDDFIAKPFDLDVLTAKVQALLRRSYDFMVPAKLLESGGAVLNVSDATLTFEGNKTELTKNEFKIMQLLLENKGRIVSRDEIMTRLWEGNSFVDENTLSVNVNRLRRKLEDAGLSDFIATKKGIGYMVGE